VNAATIVAYTYPQFHALNAGDLAGWTDADLYSYLNRSTSNLCADVALIGSSVSVAVAAGTQVVSLPAETSAIIQVQWNYTTLKPRTTAYMDARSSDWQNAPGDEPAAYVVDQQGTDFIRLHPYPVEAGTLRFWIRKRPAAQSSGSSLMVSACADLIAELEIVSEGRRKGGRFAMPEAAQAAQSVSDALREAALLYYGGAL
jgi:hypothetical protein